tara:strand:+ start:176 stop:613 length:438 start_codon:yes stop_codon:yes gene_type:complete
MSEFEINTLLNNGLIQQALYAFAFLFATWFAGRCAVVTNETGNANLFSKIVISGFGLSSIYFLNLQFTYVDFHLKNYAHSLYNLKESGADISSRGDTAIELFGRGNASEVPGMSLIPADPIGIVFIASLTLIILASIWMSGSNNE